MSIVIAVVVLLVLMIAMFSCIKMSGDLSREEEKRQFHELCKEKEQESPCESCLRWGECNGVDEECPRRDGK